MPCGDDYAGVFCCDERGRNTHIHSGFSPDGVHCDITPKPTEFIAYVKANSMA